MADLAVLERLDHAVLEGHAPDPAIALDCHASPEGRAYLRSSQLTSMNAALTSSDVVIGT